MPVISVNVYKGQGIWRLSSKYWLNNETLNQFYSNDFDSSEGPTFLEFVKLPAPLWVRRL